MTAPYADKISVDATVFSGNLTSLETDVQKALVKIDGLSLGGGGTWGSITGTLSNQTDLQSALDAKQPIDADLTSIAALGFTATAFLKKTAANTWALDTATYLTGTKADSVSNSDGTLTISPTTGAVVASINLAHANTWTVPQNFTASIGSIATPTSPTASLVAGAGASNFFSGDTLQYRIWAYKTIIGTRIYSSTYAETNQETIITDGDTVQVSWGPVTGAEGYYVVQNLNGIGYDDLYADAGNITVFVDDNDFDVWSWTFGTPTTTPSSFSATTYLNYVSGTDAYSIYGNGSAYFGDLKIARNSINYSAIRVDGTAHTSTLPSAFALYDETGGENVGLTSWSGGGGSAGYGAVVLGSYSSGSIVRWGEISGRNTYTSHRLGSIIFQADYSYNTSGIIFYGGNGGAFNLAYQIFSNGKSTLGGLSTNAGDKVEFAAGSTSAAPIRLNSGSLATGGNIRAGQFQFLTDKFYGTITTGTAVKEFIQGDNAITDAVNIVFGTTTGTKIGTATTQKLAFFNSTPIVQPANTVAINDLLVNLGLRASGGNSNFTTAIRPLLTTEQARFQYDVSNYLSITVGSTGSTVMDLVGTNPAWTFNDAVAIGKTWDEGVLQIKGGVPQFIIDSTSSTSQTNFELRQGNVQRWAFYVPASSKDFRFYNYEIGADNFTLVGTTGDLSVTSGNFKISTVGKGLYIKEGSNACMGVATLVAGTVVVSTTKVTANSRIYLTIQSLGTVAVAKGIGVTARTAPTSFTITSADATDTSVIAWQIVEPA